MSDPETRHLLKTLVVSLAGGLVALSVVALSGGSVFSCAIGLICGTLIGVVSSHI